MRFFNYIFCLLCYVSLDAQRFDVDTLMNNGPTDSRINMVYVGDGYTAEELDKFVEDASSFNEYIFSIEPFKSYRNFFNSFAVKVPSNESGADHPGNAADVSEPVIPVKTVDTYFNSTFDFFEIHRLLVPINTSRVITTLAANAPDYDQVVLIVNSSEYGGSGGFIATTSISADASEVAVHEIGHSFANLSDEYYAGDIYVGESANMTESTDPATVTWKNWHGDNGIGIYQHCCSDMAKMWYRPHQECKMRYLGVPFCSVCTEAIIERIHAFVSPLISFYPTLEDTVSIIDDLRFGVDVINPDPNTNKIEWVLNEEIVASDTELLQLSFDQLASGPNFVSVSITDTTDLLRVDNHNEIHVEIISWEFQNFTTATTELNLDGARYQLKIAPNPSDDYLNVTLEGGKIGEARLLITDLSGRVVMSETLSANLLSDIDVSGLPSSMYVVNLKVDGHVVHAEKIFIH